MTFILSWNALTVVRWRTECDVTEKMTALHIAEREHINTTFRQTSVFDYVSIKWCIYYIHYYNA